MLCTAPPLGICDDGHFFIIAERLCGMGMASRGILLEPVGCNTAPVQTVAAVIMANEGEDARILMLPWDHHMRNPNVRRDALRIADEIPTGAQVCFRMDPDRPILVGGARP